MADLLTWEIPMGGKSILDQIAYGIQCGCGLCSGCIILPLFLFMVMLGIVDNRSSSVNSSGNTISNQRLNLLSKSFIRDYDYLIAEGQVKNVGSEKLTNVLAVVSCYDENGAFISHDHALIDYDPLLAWQISPWKTMVRWNPAMERFSVEFTTFDGQLIFTE